jgi:hypothetical protein
VLTTVALENVDYASIKHVIKENTTPSKGKAISIPGQGNATETHLENLLFRVLSEQHDRVGLFIKSKSGEIQRRLGMFCHLSWPGNRSLTCDLQTI